MFTFTKKILKKQLFIIFKTFSTNNLLIYLILKDEIKNISNRVFYSQSIPQIQHNNENIIINLFTAY